MRCIDGPALQHPCSYPRYPGCVTVVQGWCSTECEELYEHLGADNFQEMTPREYIRHCAEVESAGRCLDWMYRGTPQTTMLPERANRGQGTDEAIEQYWSVCSSRQVQAQTTSPEQRQSPLSNLPHIVLVVMKETMSRLTDHGPNLKQREIVAPRPPSIQTPTGPKKRVALSFACRDARVVERGELEMSGFKVKR